VIKQAKTKTINYHFSLIPKQLLFDFKYQLWNTKNSFSRKNKLYAAYSFLLALTLL